LGRDKRAHNFGRDRPVSEKQVVPDLAHYPGAFLERVGPVVHLFEQVWHRLSPFNELVADTPDRLDFYPAAFEFLPQVGHMDINSAGVAVIIIAPDLI
jgi:hypothetical protein